MTKRVGIIGAVLVIVTFLTFLGFASLDGCNELRAVRIGPDGPQSHRCTL